MLDLRPGIGVQKAIWSRYGMPVTQKDGDGIKDFLLVASFGRCVFRLNSDSVAAMLHATLGGSLADFRPIQLDDRVFQFSVSCKVVGFHIYNLRSYECKEYKVMFHLWGHGGTTWISEAARFQQEEDDSWTLVTRKKARNQRSYAQVTASHTPLAGANQIPIQKRHGQHNRSVFDRISFPRRSVFDRLQSNGN